MNTRVLGKVELVWRLLVVAAVVVTMVAGSALVRESTALAQQANPIRDLPGVPAGAGQSFDVVVGFTAPQDGFRNIGVEDTVPAGWAIQANTTWCTPNADGVQTGGGKAQYIWFWNEYDAGTSFTALYRVTVPGGAGVASYAFDGQLGYRIHGGDRIFEDIGGESVMHGLGIGSSAGGEVTVPGEGVFVCTAGSVVDLVAVADECYEFVEWTGDTGTIDDPGAAQTTITMEGNYEIQADFQRVPGPWYDLVISSTDGGAVTVPGEGEFEYCQGAVVPLVAVADSCYEFVNWTGDTGTIDDPGAAETTITMLGDYDIQANFAEVTYQLATGSTEGGVVTVPGEPGPFTYDCGEVVDLVAAADECYEFVNWTGDTGTIDDPGAAETTITMLGDYDIQANFAEVTYTLTVNANPAEGGAVAGNGTYYCCSTVTVKATPNTCWRFDHWTGNVGNATSPETTVHIDGNKTVTANFERLQYTLTVIDSPDGAGTVTGGGTFDCCTNRTITAVPKADFRFVKWIGKGIDDPLSASTTVHIDSAKTVIAVFNYVEPTDTVVEVEDATLTVGGNATVDVWVRNVPGPSPHGLGSYEMRVYYDPTMVRIESVSAGDPRFDVTYFAIFGDYVSMTAFIWDLPPGQNAPTGDVRIADLEFDCLGAGNTTLTPVIYDLADYMSGNTTPANPVEGNVIQVEIMHTLSISSTDGGFVQVPGEGNFTYREGWVQNVVAVADECYEFEEWSGNVTEIGNATAAQTSIRMLDNYTIQANFVWLPDYVLSISSTAGGNVTVPGEGNFTRCEGTVTNLVAVAEECYEFVEWTGNVTTIGNVTAAQTTITMLSNYTVRANFLSLPRCAITAPSAVCAESTGNTASVPDAGVGATYNWNITNGTITSGNNTRQITWTAGTSSPANISVTVTDGSGCQCSANVDVTINAVPSCAITALSVVCAESTGNIASVADAGVNATYNWNVTGEGTYVSGNGTSSIIWNAGSAGTATISVAVTDAGGCQCSDSVGVTITAVPSCAITAPSAVCEGSEGNTASVPDAGANAAYNWNITGGTITVGNGTRQITWTAGSGAAANISITVTDVNGCLCSESTSVTINARDIALSVSTTDGGNVTEPGVGNFTYCENDVVPLMAVAEECYAFVNWSGNVTTVGNVTAAQTTITMHGNYTILANFRALPVYQLTISSTDGGNVTVPGEGNYTRCEGTVVPLLAVAELGYTFVDWAGNVTTIGNVTAAETTITMLGNYTIQANFNWVGIRVLTVGSTPGGNVTVPGEGNWRYTWGTTNPLVAVADECYAFEEWSGNVTEIGNVTAARTTIRMMGNYTIQANFVRLPDYMLSISSTAGGSVVDPGEGNDTYCQGRVVPLRAAPADCYRFVEWRGNVTTIGNVTAAQTTITVLGNYTIQANFGVLRYTLTVNANPAAGGTVTGNGTYDCGNRTTVAATANAGYRFVNWTGPVANPNLASTTVLMDGNKEVIANFAPVTPTPTPTSAPTPAPTGYVPSGGGVGGGGYYPTPRPTATPKPTPVVVDISSKVSGNGTVLEPISISLFAGKAALAIGSGTVALMKDGGPLQTIQCGLVPKAEWPLPPAGKFVVAAFDFGPDGANFDPPIAMTLTYDPASLPAGAAEEDLVIASYNSQTASWEFLTVTVDTVNNTITAQVAHFTAFGILGALPPMPTASPTVAPTATASPKPTPTATPTPTPTPPVGPGFPGWAIAVIVVVLLAVVGVVVYVLLRRRGGMGKKPGTGG